METRNKGTGRGGDGERTRPISLILQLRTPTLLFHLPILITLRGRPIDAAGRERETRARRGLARLAPTSSFPAVYGSAEVSGQTGVA